MTTSHVGIAVDYQTPPTTEAVGEKWEQRDPHTLACEMHMLARASHGPLREGSVDVLLVSAELGDGGEHSGEDHVALSSIEKCRSSFEKLDPKS